MEGDHNQRRESLDSIYGATTDTDTDVRRDSVEVPSRNVEELNRWAVLGTDGNRRAGAGENTSRRAGVGA